MTTYPLLSLTRLPILPDRTRKCTWHWPVSPKNDIAFGKEMADFHLWAELRTKKARGAAAGILLRGELRDIAHDTLQFEFLLPLAQCESLL